MTTSSPDARHDYTYDEYLASERASESKHEFVEGEIVALERGSIRHNALASRVIAALANARPPGSHVFQSDLRIRVLATGFATYPDVSMVCGAIEGDPADASDEMLTNPTLIVEVLAPSIERADRGHKWAHYQLIPSLREYVLVSEMSPRVEIYRRLTADRWQYQNVREGTTQLFSGATLDLSALYADLPH
jgi:Uma2 family endonuclease